MPTGQQPGGLNYAGSSRAMVEIAAEIAAAPTQEAKNALRRQYAFFVNAHNEQFGPDYIGALPVPPIPAGRYTKKAGERKQTGTGRKKKQAKRKSAVKEKKKKACSCKH